MLTLLLFFSQQVHAYVDPACAEVADTDGDGNPGPAPEGYSEEGQQNYLLNFFSAGTTFSPLHAPIPSPAGTGSFGVELSIIPPLGCDKRLVLEYTKTEDTNKCLCFLDREHLAFPAIDTKNHKIIPYAGLGYVPPVKVQGMQNVVMSVEAGVGIKDKAEKVYNMDFEVMQHCSKPLLKLQHLSKKVVKHIPILRGFDNGCQCNARIQ